MQHRYKLFEALDQATHINLDGGTVKQVTPGKTSETRVLTYDDYFGHERQMEFDDQWVVLDNDGCGHAFDMESRNPSMQFRREVLMPLPLYPLVPTPPVEVQEIITACLSAMHSIHDDEQWREFGVNLSQLMEQARMLGIPVPQRQS